MFQWVQHLDLSFVVLTDNYGAHCSVGHITLQITVCDYRTSYYLLWTPTFICILSDIGALK